jgi:putative PIN family toxin of toxin-antitoxin system
VRVLLDTNVLISGVLFRGVPRTLLERAIRGELDLVTSPALLDELEDVLVRSFEFPSELARAVRTELDTLAEVVVPAEVPPVSRDPDDDQVLAAAIVGHADAVVTGDQDLLVLETHRAIPIIRPADLVVGLEPAEEDG